MPNMMNGIRMNIPRFALTLCSILTLALLNTAYAQSDAVGAKDPEVLERYSGSWVVKYQDQPEVRYTLALGGIETVNGIERPERSRSLSGELIRLTYELPINTRTRDVYQFYAEQLKAQKAEVLFECSGRSCGSSSVWANDIYQDSKLYGLVGSQYVLNVELPGQTISIYIVERGNRRVYAHLDIVETDLAARIGAEVLNNLHAVLSVDALPDRAVLDSVINQLTEQQKQIALVVHHSGADFAQASQESDRMAEDLKALLNEVAPVQSVGAYVPSVLKDHTSVVEMVIQHP
jgi:uncharacterized protein